MSESNSPWLNVTDKILPEDLLFASIPLSGLALCHHHFWNWLYHVVITAITGKCLHPEELFFNDDFPSKCAQMDDGQQPHTPLSSKAHIGLTIPQAKSMLYCIPLLPAYINIH